MCFCAVCTKTISLSHLGVGENGGHLPLLRSIIVNYVISWRVSSHLLGLTVETVRSISEFVTSWQKRWFLSLFLCSFFVVYTNFAEHCKTEVSDSQLPDRVDYDEYDAKIFRNPLTHSTLKGWAPRGTNFRRTRSALDMQRMAKSMSKEEPIFHRISSPPRGVSSYEDMEISASFSALTVIIVFFCWMFYCI